MGRKPLAGVAGEFSSEREIQQHLGRVEISATEPLESLVHKGNHPQIALIQVKELL